MYTICCLDLASGAHSIIMVFPKVLIITQEQSKQKEKLK